MGRNFGIYPEFKRKSAIFQFISITERGNVAFRIFAGTRMYSNIRNFSARQMKIGDFQVYFDS
jgi:hypothetical protein